MNHVIMKPEFILKTSILLKMINYTFLYLMQLSISI